MKKFSFLMVGVLLLGTIPFTLADDNNNNARVLTGSVVGMPDSIDTSINLPTEVATGDTAEKQEVSVGDSVEAATGDTTEVTEVMTGDAGVETGEVVENTTSEVVESTNNENAVVTSNPTKAKYDKEQTAAYEWAFDNGITTINDIDKARLTDGLTRAELAKMMSQYMTKVLGKTPAETEKVEYADVDESLGDLADFIQTAYAYKIMGINGDGTPLSEFNPSGKVTRAEYATVFSRVLYGDKYNKSEGNYYEGHLAALKEAGILTNTTPTIQEIRGWVMLMMYRSTNPQPEETTDDTVQIANPASEYCVAQGGTVNIVKDEEGNESGMCKLADGTEVEEWEYYRANNTENETGDSVEEPEVTDGTGEVMSGSVLTVTVTPNF